MRCHRRSALPSQLAVTVVTCDAPSASEDDAAAILDEETTAACKVRREDDEREREWWWWVLRGTEGIELASEPTAQLASHVW